MIPLEVRRASKKFEDEHPNASLHEAFIYGWQMSQDSQVPMIVDDPVVSDSYLPTFEDFWNLYDKKRGKPKAEKLWNKLPLVDKLAIMEYIPNYKLAQPDKQYRKDPQTFLRNEAWNDELIFNNNTNNGKPTAEQQERTFFEESVRGFFNPKA